MNSEVRDAANFALNYCAIFDGFLGKCCLLIFILLIDENDYSCS